MKKTLAFKMTLTYLGIALFIWVILLTFITTRQRDILLSSAKENSIEQSYIFAENISLFLDCNAALLLSLADHPRSKALDEAYILNELEHLFLHNEDLFVNAFYLSLNGILTDIQGNTFDYTGFYYHDNVLNGTEDFMITGIDKGPITNTPMFSIGVPIRDENGSNIGAIGASINVFQLADLMETVRLGDSSYAWITDETGRVVTHPNKDYPYNITLDDAEDLGYIGFESIKNSILTFQGNFAEYYDDNLKKDKILTYAYIPNTPGWSLNITTLKSDIFADVYRFMRDYALLTVPVMGILIYIIYTSSLRLTKPIRQLTEQVRIMDDDRPVYIETGSNHLELYELAGAYNNMVDKINLHTDELESMVAERTNALDALNNQLNLQNNQLAKAVQQLNKKVIVDELTGLNNRGAIFHQLEWYHAQIKKNSMTCYTLLFVDLDNFKYYNDHFGHDIGDVLLIEIAQILKACVRQSDFVGRYGGDEFIILLPNSMTRVTERIIGDMHNRIKDYSEAFTSRFSGQIPADTIIPESYYLGASIGHMENDAQSLLPIDAILKSADQMMYEAKRSKKSSRL